MPLTRPASPPILSDPVKTISLLLIPASVAVIAARSVLDVPAPVSDPLLLLALNIAFLTIIPLYIAYVSLVSFRFGGAVSTLLLGAGMLFVGLGTLTSAIAQLLPNAVNLAVTIFNITACLGMALSLAGCLVALIVWRETSAERRSRLAGAAYGVVVAVTAAVVLAALGGLTPVFFVPGVGSTVVRELVLAAAIQFALLASVLYFVLYRRRREDFFFWYGIGLALVGIGLVTVAFIAVFGGLLNLAGRFEQYIGACYLLGAFVLLQRRAASQNVSVQEVLASFFAQAEAGYRQLVETAGDAIIVIGPGDRILLWNTAAEQMFGYTADEAVGLTFPDLVLGSGPIPPMHGTPSPDRQELEVRRRDGTRFPVALTASSRAVDGQRITTFIVHDLTERVRAEEALRESEERMRLALTNAPTVLFHQDHDLRYTWMSNPNPAYTGPDVLGRTDADVMPPDDAAVLTALKRQVLETGVGTRAEVRTTLGGVPFYYDLTLEPFTDAAGKTIGVIGISHDITDLKQAELALERYAADLERSNEDLERFAYVSSHDLQEPLRSIVSFSQLLERRYRGQLGADADEYIDFIVEGGNRMQTLILDLLAYSRVNSKAQELRPTDVEAVMGVVERHLDPQLRDAGATLTYDSLPVVTADPLQLEQVFANLVSNAIKFRKPDEPLRIHVGARRLDGVLEFSVADNGIGIETEYYDRIFVIFQRLHTKEAYPGTGIGLAIVKRIVDRHGGTIRVESTPGEGSTFFFTLPAA